MELMRIISVAVLVIGVSVSGVPGSPAAPAGKPGAALLQKCAKDNGLDMEGMMKATPELTPEFLCFLKCVGEASGFITGTGELDLSKVDSLPLRLAHEKGEKFTECLSKTTKVEKCEDLSESAECILALHKEEQS